MQEYFKGDRRWHDPHFTVDWTNFKRINYSFGDDLLEIEIRMCIEMAESTKEGPVAQDCRHGSGPSPSLQG